MTTKHFCDDCGTELEIIFKNRVSNKRREVIPHDAPLSYKPVHNIYKYIEGSEEDVVIYDYYECGMFFRCPKCGQIYYPNGLKV
jgi:predicted RNA-binding Zn-ribbon protein involved in translation (DUF1610 family)